MNKMKVQKGWEDVAHTIPHYEHVDKIDIMWIDKGNTLSLHKNINLKQRGLFWHCEFNMRAFVIEPGTVFWFNDRPVCIIQGME